MTYENETFNIGNSEPYTMKELARLIYDYTNTTHPVDTKKELKFDTVKSFPNDVRRRVPNIDKMKVVFDWVAEHNTEFSVKKCVDHYYQGLKWQILLDIQYGFCYSLKNYEVVYEIIR